jgi:hypothetical protein
VRIFRHGHDVALRACGDRPALFLDAKQFSAFHSHGFQYFRRRHHAERLSAAYTSVLI